MQKNYHYNLHHTLWSPHIAVIAFCKANELQERRNTANRNRIPIRTKPKNRKRQFNKYMSKVFNTYQKIINHENRYIGRGPFHIWGFKSYLKIQIKFGSFYKVDFMKNPSLLGKTKYRWAISLLIWQGIFKASIDENDQINNEKLLKKFFGKHYTFT